MASTEDTIKIIQAASFHIRCLKEIGLNVEPLERLLRRAQLQEGDISQLRYGLQSQQLRNGL